MAKGGIDLPMWPVLVVLEMKATCKIKVKSPSGERWERVKVIFDTEVFGDQIMQETLGRLGIKAGLGEKVFVHVNIAGQILSWPFLVVSELQVEMVFGKEFIQVALLH